MNKSNPFAAMSQRVRHLGAIGLFLLLSACSVPGTGARPVVYDFGPGLTASATAAGEVQRSALLIEMIDANPALESTAMLYRLAYANSQQLQPYALARWSMTPSQLLGQRLREHLSQRYTLLRPGDKDAGARTLRIELDEFSQLFAAPDSSAALLRLRASVTAAGATAAAQRSIIVQRSAPSADAPGGARAMGAAVETALQELDLWLQALGRP
jgi:cholesterol transport system auxiliary component